MFGVFVSVVVLGLAGLSEADPFVFPISRNFSSIKPLEEELWSWVELSKEDQSLQVKVKIPVNIQYSDIYVFFANDTKAILNVTLTDKILGTFYSIPYKAEKNMEGETTTVESDENYKTKSGGFPLNWMPENVTKVSATVVDAEKVYYNYYGIQNYDISFYDLMVVEEYKNYKIE